MDKQNIPCTVCHGDGGTFDSGFWYGCPSCKPATHARTALQHPVGAGIKKLTSDLPKKEAVKHPTHYGKHPSGIECIDVVQHMSFNLGNAVKYIWRADLKNDAIEDMKKAIQYLEFEIAKRTKK